MSAATDRGSARPSSAAAIKRHRWTTRFEIRPASTGTRRWQTVKVALEKNQDIIRGVRGGRTRIFSYMVMGKDATPYKSYWGLIPARVKHDWTKAWRLSGRW